MKALLTVTAVIETGAGVALVCCPSTAAVLLLGSRLDAPASIALGRVAGVALLSLGVACWLARGDAQSRAAMGIVKAMVLYNLGVNIILGTAGIWWKLIGIVLWPAVALHIAMAVWCIMCLLKKRL